MSKTLSIQVIVEHGQTPTGFGLALHERHIAAGAAPQWCLRPLSPCCGAFIDYGLSGESLHCVNCSTSWQDFSDDCRGTIGNDVPIGNETRMKDSATLARWYARIMGYPNPEGNHEVKVSITWS